MDSAGRFEGAAVDTEAPRFVGPAAAERHSDQRPMVPGYPHMAAGERNWLLAVVRRVPDNPAQCPDPDPVAVRPAAVH